MAIIPNDEKLMIIDDATQTKYTGSDLLQERQRYYTIQDLKDTVGGGGGGGGASAGLGSLKIEADGQIGNPLSMTVSVVVPVVDVIPGVVNTYEAISAASIQLSGMGGYGGGGTFTATTVSFPDLTYAYSVNINSTTTLQTISFPDLEILASSVYLMQNSGVETISMPNLTSCSNLDISYMPNLANLVFTSLVSAGNLGTNGDGGAFTNINDTQFPALRKTGFSGNGIYSINLPALTTVTGINFYSNDAQSINLPGIVDFQQNYLPFENKYSLTNFIVGTVGTIKSWGTINEGQLGPYTNPFVSISNCSLDQASVDNILVVLASLDGTNGTTQTMSGTLYLNGGNNAQPSQTGLDAKALLLDRGWNIAIN